MMTDSFDANLLNLFEYRPRKGELKKIEIIEAAIDCLSSLGIENTTFESIATKIGTRRAHVAYHFSSKKSIYTSSVRFILMTYQNIVVEHMKTATTGKTLLMAYAEGSFTWAINHPKQLSVMLMLYYMCTLDEEFLNLHDQVRTQGAERLTYILSEKFNGKYTKRAAASLAKTLQNLMTGSMIDAMTRKDQDLQKAKEDVLKTMLKLLE